MIMKKWKLIIIKYDYTHNDKMKVKWYNDKVKVKEWENRCRWLLEGAVDQTNFIKDDNEKVKRV